MVDKELVDTALEIAKPAYEKLKGQPKEVQKRFFYEIGQMLMMPDQNTYNKEWEGLLSAGTTI